MARPNRMAPYYASMLRISHSSDYFASLSQGFGGSLSAAPHHGQRSYGMWTCDTGRTNVIVRGSCIRTARVVGQQAAGIAGSV